MPTRVHVRRQGGATIMTIPVEVARALAINVGDTLDVEVADGALTAKPRGKPVRRRYSLRELLRGATPQAIRRLNRETAWAREGEAVGREL